MKLKDKLLENMKEFLDKLDDDISEIYEEHYKIKVSLNTIISLMIKKGIFTRKEFEEEMRDVRERIRKE